MILACAEEKKGGWRASTYVLNFFLLCVGILDALNGNFELHAASQVGKRDDWYLWDQRTGLIGRKVFLSGPGVVILSQMRFANIDTYNTEIGFNYCPKAQDFSTMSKSTREKSNLHSIAYRWTSGPSFMSLYSLHQIPRFHAPIHPAKCSLYNKPRIRY